MPGDLPEFKKVRQDMALAFARTILTNEHQTPPKSHFHQLIAYEDGHWRVVFDPAYFILAEGQTAPSKSQWNTLKKKIRRHYRDVFVFKDHGEIKEGEKTFYWLDFGFFAR